MTSLDQQRYVASLAQQNRSGAADGYTVPSDAESSTSTSTGGDDGTAATQPQSDEPPSLALNRQRLFASFGLSPDSCSKTWRLVVELIASMLAFDAAKRVTAAAALKHPYVAHLFTKDTAAGGDLLRSHAEMYGPADPTAWEFDSRDVGAEELRAMFWEEMNKTGANHTTTLPPANADAPTATTTDAGGKVLGSEAFFAAAAAKADAP